MKFISLVCNLALTTTTKLSSPSEEFSGIVPSNVQSLIDTLDLQHQKEMDIGFRTFRNSIHDDDKSISEVQQQQQRTNKQIDLIEHLAPKGSAGPDELTLGENGNVIYESDVWIDPPVQ